MSCAGSSAKAGVGSRGWVVAVTHVRIDSRISRVGNVGRMRTGIISSWKKVNRDSRLGQGQHTLMTMLVTSNGFFDLVDEVRHDEWYEGLIGD